jgi:hypothetical protein
MEIIKFRGILIQDRDDISQEWYITGSFEFESHDAFMDFVDGILYAYGSLISNPNIVITSGDEILTQERNIKRLLRCGRDNN